MDFDIINECKSLSLKGQITFPEVVAKLASIGVERYIIDLVGLKGLYYSVKNESYLSDFDFNPLPISQRFDIETIKNTIADIQQELINYQTFLQRIIESGCSHYEVYITGRKVIYFGRDGSHHIELFPS